MIDKLCAVLGVTAPCVQVITVDLNIMAESIRSCRGKAIPLQAWIGPEGSGRLMLSDFKTVRT